MYTVKVEILLSTLCILSFTYMHNVNSVTDIMYPTMTPEMIKNSACVSIEKCPPLFRLLGPHMPQATVNFLKQAHCGFQGRYPNVWCNKADLKSDCVTPDLRNGSCIPLEHCTDMKMNTNATYEDLENYQCDHSVQYGVHVCCSLNLERNQNLLPQPENYECGYVSIDSKIVGGVDAELDEFPWLAILQYSTLKGLRQACSGSLINRRYVVTAAHCVDSEALKEMEYKELHSVVLGEFDTRNVTDCVNLYCAPLPITVRVQSTILHPQWQWPLRTNDIALLRLIKDVELSEFVRPICLPKPHIALSIHEPLFIAGWGRSLTYDREHRSPVKMKGIVSRRPCPFSDPEESSVVCSGANGTDICNGDSGGPLMFMRLIDEDYVMFLGGIASLGISRCGRLPSFFTYVPPYMDWILQTLKIS